MCWPAAALWDWWTCSSGLSDGFYHEAQTLQKHRLTIFFTFELHTYAFFSIRFCTTRSSTFVPLNTPPPSFCFFGQPFSKIVFSTQQRMENMSNASKAHIFSKAHEVTARRFDVKTGRPGTPRGRAGAGWPQRRSASNSLLE